MAAKPGWIIVGRRGALEGPPSGVGWDQSLAGTNSDMMMVRADVMRGCGVSRSIQGNQKAQGQNGTHHFCTRRRKGPGSLAEPGP
jgi:hypothetical protein